MEAIETLTRLNVFTVLSIDVVIYDILGDVVCGGFSLPIRKGYAQETYVITSGELEALYQFTNVSKAIRRFDKRAGSKLGGLIVNLRRMKNELDIVTDFARLARFENSGNNSLQPDSEGVRRAGHDRF